MTLKKEETALDQLLKTSKEGASLKRKREITIQPRWYNQAYLLFLALRQAPQHSLPRLKLIEKAIELDKKIGNELQLPRVFRGKTPKNSASATLTNNSDRYFISYRPEGSRNTHFKLAYEPGNVDEAVTEYQKWCKKLVEHDWPFCFGVPKEKDLSETTSHYHTPISHPEEMDTLSPRDQEQEDMIEISQKLDSQVYIEKYSSPIPSHEQSPMTESENNQHSTTNSDNLSHHDSSSVNTPNNDSQSDHGSTGTNTPMETDSPPNQRLNPPPPETPANSRSGRKQPIPPEPFISLDTLDLSNIPTSWRDIVEVAPSKIPGGGNGLFAKRKLPYNTPIGFYFGVPMSEDEFDALKDRVGRSSEYSIMYRRTVLDATDETGEPIMDSDSPRFCPFHFMNETSSQKTASVAFVEGALVNQIICWTKKVIEQGEELLVWYGKDVHRYWTEEQVEANRKKEQKELKMRQVQERKQGRLQQKQEKLRLIEENRKRREEIRLQKLEEERLRKLKKEEERKLKKEMKSQTTVTKKEKKTIVELEAPENGEFRIVDETLSYFTKEEYNSLPILAPPKKDFVFVISTKTDMEEAEDQKIAAINNATSTMSTPQQSIENNSTPQQSLEEITSTSQQPQAETTIITQQPQEETTTILKQEEIAIENGL